ncbi:MAG: Crp/Fnr family transcriptional regulator [Acidobacteriota bacterium]
MKPLLQNISGSLMADVTRLGKRRVFYTDETIFNEGDKALFLPIVISGRIKMIHFLELGKEVIIGIFEEGEMFAVPPVFDGKTYPSTAIAMEETLLLLLQRRVFLELLRESDEFAFAIIGWMSEMLREKTQTIQNLAMSSPDHRVAAILLKLAQKEAPHTPVKISLRREDIAKMAGLTTETTIRVVRRLAKLELLTIVHGKIIVESTTPLLGFLDQRM